MTEKVGAGPRSTSRIAGGARKRLIQPAIVSSPTVSRIVFHGIAGVQQPVVARVSGDPDALREAGTGLPEGAATPEAIAARIRRSGGELEWGEPESFGGTRSVLSFFRARGASSVEVVRAEPTLLPELQLGSYFASPFTRRVVRRLLLAAHVPVPAPLEIAADAAFWSGVRRVATAREWERLARSSYVGLYYHRIAGEGKPGQERLDVSPAVFEKQMRWLRRLRLRPLAPEALIAFHTEPRATLPRRSIFLAADDGFRDAVVALRRHGDLRPYVFVPTSAVGGSASWVDGEPVASWSELRELASRGGVIGSHGLNHVSFPELSAAALAAELGESMRELRAQIPEAAPLLAYPHGRNDATVRAAADEAGYRAAFSSETGRNGAGTDRLALRRVELKEWDGPAAVTWKALTGELVPWPIERRRLQRRAAR
jgi:peptidoglycan/xylan/chitin deacetylase (PgdA/CDA1 family)